MSKSKNKIKKTIEMRKEDATKWLDALRSGKYEQGTGSLCEGDAYCCLGVLQDVLGKVQYYNDLPSLRWLKDHNIKIQLETEEELTNGRNTEVDIPLIPAIGEYDSVAQLNDSREYSFKQIANILDKRIKRV